MQASHAAYEAGQHGSPDDETKSLVLCQTDSEAHLVSEAARLEARGIPHIIFREPNLDNQATAIATLPLNGSQRKKLSAWKLWEPKPP